MNILGVVRNGRPGLGPTLKFISAFRSRLSESRVIVATNDNTDGTDSDLAAFSRNDGDVQILDLGKLEARFPERVDRIAAARNATLKAMFSTPAHPTTLVLDLDGPNAGMTPEMVMAAELRRSAGGWDAAFANQPEAYYDIYALRCAGWCEEDIWSRIADTRKPLLFRRRKYRVLVQEQVYKRQYRIPPETPAIKVDSAFGGLGLYTTEALKGLSYTARDARGRLTCEHVALNLAIGKAGGRLCIDPALTNATQPEHLGPGSGAPLPANLV